MRGRTPGKASKLEELSQTETARRLKVDSRDVRKWMEWHRGRGGHKLSARMTPGRPSRPDKASRRRLESMLLMGPRVAKLIQSEFGVRYNPAYVSQLLRKLGWSPQSPENRAIERDEAKILGWHRRTWAPTGETPILRQAGRSR
jgi:transposase